MESNLPSHLKPGSSEDLLSHLKGEVSSSLTVLIESLFLINAL